jgi:hypothetical protein
MIEKKDRLGITASAPPGSQEHEPCTLHASGTDNMAGAM